jgi:hypothetical protein
MPAPGRSLAEMFPQVAARWDSKRNGSLTPYDVTYGSEREVWWRCDEEDNHLWLAKVTARVQSGGSCPFCSGRRASATHNLALADPSRAALWHPSKNGTLTPRDVTPSADRTVWWRCAKGPDHEWQARVCKQTQNCPFCANHLVSVTNSLATTHPQIARLWDRKKNGALTPRMVVAGAIRSVWWRCPAGPDHAWREAVVWTAQKKGCPFCGNWRLSVTNSLATVAPEIARHLHPSKNGKLTARDISAYSHRRVWWSCGEDPRHIWQASVYMRVRNGGWVCSMCSNRRISPSTSLAAQCPKLAAQWDGRKNGTLTPTTVSIGHSRRVWWRCPAAPDHEWQVSVKSRVFFGTGCPFCSNKRVAPSNSLARMEPRLARLWHPRKNQELSPTGVVPGSGKRVWWRCPRGADHEWEARVVDLVAAEGACHFCAGRRVSVTNSLAALFPKVAREWNRPRNRNITPADVLAAARDLAWWRCPLGHEWRASVRDRTIGGKACPVCADVSLRIEHAARRAIPSLPRR